MSSAPKVEFKVEGADALAREAQGMKPKMRAAVISTLKTYAIKVQRTIKHKLSQPGSGRTYQRGGVTHQASAPGEPPATDTGRLRSSIQHALQGLTAVVFTNVEYARALELGYPANNLEPRPFMRPSLEEHADDLRASLIDAIDQSLS